MKVELGERTSMDKKYKNENCYPYEAFVQESIENTSASWVMS
jgi:hypothetical protein